MDRENARREIRNRWREIIATMTSPARQRVNGETSWICPLCGHGLHGDGLTRNPRSKDGNGLKCFGCQFTGDILDLISQKNNSDHNSALQIAADTLNIAIDRYSPENGINGTISAPDAISREIHTEAPANAQEAPTEPPTDYTEYYSQCSARLSEKAAMDYLQGRGISRQTAAAYSLGYDPAWISPTAVKRLQAEGNSWTPPATARIILPVKKDYYIARAIDPATADKYKKMNEGESGIFNTEALYGDSKAIFVVEGIFDALSCIEAGAQAIALNSTSNAGLLIKQLEKTPTGAKLIICLDNDDAGQGAADTLKQGLERLKIDYTTADICAGYKDPNEALTGNREAFTSAIRAAQQTPASDPLTDFLEKIQTEAYKPYRTELSFFDDLLGGGVIQQSLLLLMAAPGTGKTTLCQQISEAMAAHQKKVIYLNFEMSREQMFAKAISARVSRKGLAKSATDILQGYSWTDQERRQITAEVEEYRQKIYPYIKYNPDGMTADLDRVLDYLKRVGEHYKAKGEQAPAVIIDYLHLMTSSRGLDVQELIKQAITGLKDYAKNNGTFVVAILATNREANKSGRFTMESARDSSNLEYTGDYQLSLNYAAIDDGTVKTTDTEGMARLQREPWRQMIIRVHKHRLGVPGRSANVYFHAASNTFYGEHDFMPADDTRLPWGSFAWGDDDNQTTPFSTNGTTTYI